MHAHGDLRIKVVASDEERDAWRTLSEDASIGSMHQCLWWAEPLRRYRVTSHALGVWRSGRLVGGCLFRSMRVPYVNTTVLQSLDGPIFLEWQRSWADAFTAALEDLARSLNAIEIGMMGCRSADHVGVHADLVSALRAKGNKVVLSQSTSKAVIPLERRTAEDVWRGMRKMAQTSVKKGLKRTQVRSLIDDGDLRKAHDAWLATARRKGFSDVRPWIALQPVLRHSVDAGKGAVLASFDGNALLAAIFVSYVGRVALYVYGGYLDGCERFYPNHVLHHEAIAECLRRGVKAYSLGNLSAQYPEKPSGADQFKLTLGAVPTLEPDAISWKRRPLLCDVVDWLRGTRGGRRISAALKRHVVRRADVQE